jgi:hypothetical protein
VSAAKHTALPFPSSISLPSSLCVAAMYSSSSSSSSPGNPSRLKNAQRKKSFKLSLFIVSAGAEFDMCSSVTGQPALSFTTAFPCLCCSRDEQGDDEKQSVMIDGCSAWDAHVSVAHGEVARIWTVESYIAVRKRKRQVEVEEITMVQSRECSATAQDVVTTPASTDEPHTENSGVLPRLRYPSHDPLLLDEDRKRVTR